ncbi:MAG: hypothetical protein GY937_16705 [bacterium]|nr:hypothetical protein [bacterium]
MRTPDTGLIHDTTAIIDHPRTWSAENVPSAASIHPSRRALWLLALQFEAYGEEELLVPAMHRRRPYHVRFILGEFDKSDSESGIVAPWQTTPRSF